MHHFVSNILSILDLFENEILKNIMDSQMTNVLLALATILPPIFGLINYLQRMRMRIKRVYKSERFPDSFLREHTRFFKPNDIVLKDHTVEENQSSIEYLAELFMDNNKIKNKFYLLKAATGIGKTTFVINLFLAVTKRIDNIEYRRITTENKKIRYWLASMFRHIWSGIQSIKPAFRKKGIRHVILVHFNDLVNDIQLLDTYIDKDKAKQTIVLVDAIDEYIRSGIDSTNYWEKFSEDWESISTKLAKFGVVLLSVREQYISENNKITNNLRIADNKLSEIELSFFRQKQVMEYIKERYNDDNITHFVNRFYILQEEQGKSVENEEVFQIPLILSKAGEIIAYQDEIRQTGYSLYSIYKAIVKSWLKREDIDHIIDLPNIELLCQRIAYQFTQEETHYLGIPEGELENLKTESNIEALRKITGHRERTLLRRQEEVTSNYTTGTSRIVYYHFAHRVFLEFFLVELALQNREYEAKIPFERFSSAADMFIKQRWEEKKEYFPKVREDDLKDIRYEYRSIYIPTLGVNFMRKTHQFFKEFSNNTYIMDKLRSPNKEEGLFLLENKPVMNIAAFKDLHNTVISNVNFWDESISAPIPDILEVIPFIRSFINVLNLDAIPITDEDLFCFEGIDSLEELNITRIPINGNKLNGTFIRYFANSRYKLKTLHLAHNKITDDEMLKPLEGANSLKTLDLNGNELNGTCIRYFENSRSTLERLGLVQNKITDDEMFKPLEGANALVILYLSNNELNGTCIGYFANSCSTLQILLLDNNKITDDEMLKPLEEVNTLEDLNLNDNELNGTCIRYFANSRSTLVKLRLGNNKIINENLLEPLKGANQLSLVELQDNPVGDKIVVDYLRESADTLQTLMVTIDGEPVNIADEIIKQWNTNN